MKVYSAFYNNIKVAVKVLSTNSVETNRQVLQEIRSLIEINSQYALKIQYYVSVIIQ